MHVIGSDRIDVADQDAGSERVAVRALPQRRIDLADVTTFPIDVVGQAVRAQ
jgi:hypothetical protein